VNGDVGIINGYTGEIVKPSRYASFFVPALLAVPGLSRGTRLDVELEHHDIASPLEAIFEHQRVT
jgi:hypothetical protein